MNQVQKISLNFSGENEFFFRSLYADWDMYWTTKMEKITERVLDKYNDASFLIELDQINLELGTISESDFNLKFILKYEEELENELLKYLYGNDTFTVKKIKIKKSRAELLFHFLLHGSLPWNTDVAFKNINLLFLDVAANESKSLRSFLRTYGHYTSLQQRLVLQCNDEVLMQGIKVIAPTESDFIVSYVQFVQSKHKLLNSQEISESPFQETVWLVVYAYLLTNRSSFFDKKSFLEQTIRQLANRYSISYSDLLDSILVNFKKELKFPLELFNLLTALKLTKYTIESTSRDWRKWLKLLVLANTTPVTQSNVDKQLTIKMLSNDQNFRFLQLLDEPKILNLLVSLAPQHAPFIKTYVKELEQQQKHGILQGKAGSEFRILKWRVIFPILLENNGTGFNRHYFVERVLLKISAHYNLKIIEILSYLQSELSSLKIDSALIKIFQDIFQRYQSNEATQLKYHKITVEDIIFKLKNKTELSIEEKNTWQNFISKVKNRNSLLNKLTDTEQKQLIQTIYPKDSTFILAYSELIQNNQNKGALEGKTSGNLNKLKWQFIHEVVLESKYKGFNKRHFVEGVIKKIAAHYNLKSEQLFSFIYLEIKRKEYLIPFELIQLMELIQKDYELNLLTKERQLEVEKTKEFNQAKLDLILAEELLEKYFGKDTQVMTVMKLLLINIEFTHFIEPVLQIEAELRKFIFSKWNITINKKQLMILLWRISKESTSLSKAAILNKVIISFIGYFKNEAQKLSFNEFLIKLSKKNYLVKQSLELQQELVKELGEEVELEENEETPSDVVDKDGTFIENAGLIMLAPFLPRLFTMLELTENGKFKDRDAQIKAIFLMQYAVFETTNFPEFELGLNKLLVGFKTGVPLPLSIELSTEEKSTVNGMLQGAVQHWGKVTTIDGLRQGFLQRDGKLDKKSEEIELVVESKAFDMLLDAIPWNFRTTRFSWMEKAIQVKWR